MGEWVDGCKLGRWWEGKGEAIGELRKMAVGGLHVACHQILLTTPRFVRPKFGDASKHFAATMDNFDDYIRQGEPTKAEKATVWKTAIGLQQVDGLQPSNYLIETAKQNIEGEITLGEVHKRIESYYERHQAHVSDGRTEEADKVSARIAELLSEQAFTFSAAEYLNIHKRLFTGIYEFAGLIRQYNITKREWVLNGETVLYGNSDTILSTLEYDLQQEKKFPYRGLSKQNVVEHIAQFISNLWQIHPFGEGNTRTTAVFLVKYLRTLGFEKVKNDLFADHSLYFRNALVRANYQNISTAVYKTDTFLIRFLSNLLLGLNHSLRNRDLHIQIDTKKEVNDTVNQTVDTVNDTVFSLLQQDPTITAKEISERLSMSLSSVRRRIKELKESGKVVRMGSDKTGHWIMVN